MPHLLSRVKWPQIRIVMVGVGEEVEDGGEVVGVGGIWGKNWLLGKR